MGKDMDFVLKLKSQLTPEIIGALVMSVLFGATVTYLLLSSKIQGLSKQVEKAHVNLAIDKSNEKVVHTCQIGEIEDGGKAVYCRCWRSKKFPYCDGSHVTFNKETGDNVGPLIVQKPAAESK